jgi:hypothetical protein
MKTLLPSFATLLFIPLLLLPAAQADEGMWLFNAPPTKQLQEKYGFTPTQEWLDHLQKASVRFNVGGSGSFVSPDGLIITNHHVGSDALQKFSDAQHNYLREGFYAKTNAEEKPCLDLELNVLMSIEDVTERVKAAIKPDMDAAAALAARRAIIANIEKDSNDKTGLRSNVVTLYEGGEYQLYRFKRYTDVRLVFAPEVAAAFFGGDPDNFEYPRFDLDVCIFRAYENGKPAHPEEYLKWSAHGSADHELVFVSGHPGSTARQDTLDVLADQRDRALPRTLALLYRRESVLQSYSARSLENERRARDDLFGIQNSRKALTGELAGLLDPEFFGKLVSKQHDLQQKIEASGRFPGAAAAYAKIAAAQKAIATNAPVQGYYEGGRRAPLGLNSTLFVIAKTLLRAAAEQAKPNAIRLPEFRESNRPSLELQLFSTEPIYNDFEVLKLTDSLTALCAEFGENDPTVQLVLAGKGPRERAEDLVLHTKLADVGLRKKLYEGGAAALQSFDDPMLAVARAIDPIARTARKTYEEQDEIQQQAYAQISKARFALEGASDYPDATFTLRLSYGTNEGYQEGGHAVPAFTDLAGLFQRSTEHEDKPPFDIPPSWIASKNKLNLSTPFDFVCTADIIGGNSGSPVVNKAGEFVGIIFDGNIQSLPLDFAYTDKQARAVSVDSRAIIEALTNVYHDDGLVEELTGHAK